MTDPVAKVVAEMRSRASRFSGSVISDELSVFADRLSALSAQAGLPDGYAVVPIEPTQEMLNAGFLVDLGNFQIESPADAPSFVWQAMIGAAPKVAYGAACRGQWRPIESGYPEEGETTLCYEPRKGNIFASQFLGDIDGKPGWVEEYYEKSPTTDGCRGGWGHWPFITHWMPLPAAPEVG